MRMSIAIAGMGLLMAGTALAGPRSSRSGRADTTTVVAPTLSKLPAGATCTPGQRLKLEGRSLGGSDGQVRLIGFFPNRYVYLNELDWSPTSVAATIPALDGAVDQPVFVQVLRDDGEATAPVPCDFVATRVRKRVSTEAWRPGGRGCNLGKNPGNCLADDVQDLAKLIPTGCWHRNNSCGLPDDLHGTDKLRTKGFLNGWRIQSARLNQPNFEDTSDEGVHTVTIKANGKSDTFSVDKGGRVDRAVDPAKIVHMLVSWRVPSSDFFQYTVSFEVEGPKGVPMFEEVTIPAPSSQTLDDWNPTPDAPKAPIALVKPVSGKWISAKNRRGLKLQISSEHRLTSSSIEFEWIKYASGKDPSIEKYTPVPSAPTSIAVDALSKRIPVDQFAGPGEYAVRARLPGGVWTDYRNFTIGKPYLSTKPKKARAHSKTVPKRRSGG